MHGQTTLKAFLELSPLCYCELITKCSPFGHEYLSVALQHLSFLIFSNDTHFQAHLWVSLK